MKMFNLDVDYLGVTLSIVLEDKFCIFNGNSGDGKTFLFKVIKSLCIPRNLKCVYVDYNYKDSTLEGFAGLFKDADIVCLDNAELYITDELIQLLDSLGILVLLNLKYRDQLMFKEFCEYAVKFDEESIIAKRV